MQRSVVGWLVVVLGLIIACVLGGPLVWLATTSALDRGVAVLLMVMVGGLAFLIVGVGVWLARRPASVPRTDREVAAAWARNILAHPDRYAIVDTETTGLDALSEVVQFAAIDPTGATLVDTLVRPRTPVMPVEAERVHGISMDMLASAPAWRDLTHQLAVLKGRTLIAYNAKYDQRLVAQTVHFNGGVTLAPWECAMLAYAQFVGEWDPKRNRYRWHKLPKGDHSAVGDCVATLNVIRQMAQ